MFQEFGNFHVLKAYRQFYLFFKYLALLISLARQVGWRRTLISLGRKIDGSRSLLRGAVSAFRAVN
jgi:hypothetical protein